MMTGITCRGSMALGSGCGKCARCMAVAPITAKEKLESLTEKDFKIITLEATVAQQAQMIEHLRGGPTPLYTAVDMANAAADGFRDGAASVVVQMPSAHDYSNPDIAGAAILDCMTAIQRAGGRVKP